MTATMTRAQDGPRRRGEPTELVSVIGINGDPLGVPGMLALDSGRWLRGGNEIVIGRTLATGKSIKIGDVLRLNGGPFTVVGIGNLRGFTSFGQNAVAYMEYPSLIQHAQLGNTLNVMAIQTQQPSVVRQRLDDLGGLSSWTPDQLVSEA